MQGAVEKLCKAKAAVCPPQTAEEGKLNIAA